MEVLICRGENCTVGAKAEGLAGPIADHATRLTHNFDDRHVVLHFHFRVKSPNVNVDILKYKQYST